MTIDEDESSPFISSKSIKLFNNRSLTFNLIIISCCFTFIGIITGLFLSSIISTHGSSSQDIVSNLVENCVNTTTTLIEKVIINEPRECPIAPVCEICIECEVCPKPEIHKPNVDYIQSLKSTAHQYKQGYYWKRSNPSPVQSITMEERQTLFPESLTCNTSQVKHSLKQLVRGYNMKQRETNLPILDVFTFNDEWQWLLIRIHENFEHVDLFVIVECEYSFTNQSKPLHYANKFRRWTEFQEWEAKGKIFYYKCNLDKFPFQELDNYKQESDGDWSRERYIRLEMNHAFELARKYIIDIKGLADDIPILGMVSDIDQVARAEHLSLLAQAWNSITMPKRLHLKGPMFFHRLGCFTPAYFQEPIPYWIHGPVLAFLHPNESLEAEVSFYTRGQETNTFDYILCSSTHCSNCLDNEQLLSKFKSFSHQKELGLGFKDENYLNDARDSCFFNQFSLDRSFSDLPGRSFLLANIDRLRYLLPL